MGEITLKLQRKMGRDCERYLSRDEITQLYRQGITASRNENWHLVTNDDGAYNLRHSTKKEVRTWAVTTI